MPDRLESQAPLIWAVSNDSVDMVRFLINMGANVKIKDKN